MKKYLFFILLFYPLFLSAENHKIEGVIKNYNAAPIFLSSVYGDKLEVLDSIQTDRNGYFMFNFNEGKPKGMYRLFFANNQKLDLLYNQEDIVFETTLADPINQIIIKKSIENKVYYDYLRRRNYDQYRLELLQPVLMYYPKTDPFFKTISTEFNRIQQGLAEFTRDLLFKNKNTYSAAIIALDQKPLLQPELNPEQQQLFLREHYFDQIKFEDESLLQSNAITSCILSYLSLYQNQNLTKDQLEGEFMRAVEVILTHTQSNIEIHNFVINYLIGGFESYGFNKVITHMADWLSDPENCKIPENKNSLQDRLNTIKKLSPGNPAPIITGFDISGKAVNLSSIKSKYTLVVFWASWCPHCTQLIPKFAEFYQSQKDQLEVISISLDTSRVEMNAFLDPINPGWINMAEFKGWDGKAAIDYGIHATPTFFLLDENKKIIGQLDTVNELKKLLK